MSLKLTLRPEPWSQHGATSARGLAFDLSGRMLSGSALAALFDGLANREAWLSTAAALNGCFAAVRVDNTEIRACVDRLRTYPLFVAHEGGDVLVSDDPALAAGSISDVHLDPLSFAEFRLTGYVTGASTLVQGLDQVRAGHCLFYAPRQDVAPGQRKFYEFRHRDFFDDDSQHLTQSLVETHARVFRRLMRSAGDRQIVIPLSGGHDSRLIGVMLRDLGCRNILCYSYGVEGNWEARISRQVADYLGFRWKLVPYSSARWRTWSALPEFQRYFRAAGHFAAVPHFQDWPAIYELQRSGDLAKDAVFVPGHSGDFLAGSHIPLWFEHKARITRTELLESIFNAHYTLWDWPRDGRERLRNALIQRIDKVCGPVVDASPEEAADQFECWDCQERQAKFIVNSVRVYEFFGYEWRLPLFDSELMDFWSHVPLEKRVGRSLYFDFARRYQALPVTPANADRPIAVARALAVIKRSSLWPHAKRLQRVLRRLQWRGQYDGVDGMGWLALIDREQFRTMYTGREIGHSFFALKYLDAIAPGGVLEHRP